jgi:hypothetical protein
MDMERVLESSVDEYVDIKAHLFSELGIYPDHRPLVNFPTHWSIEMEEIRVDFGRGDESAIYHVRTTLELMLQIALKYLEDPTVEKRAKEMTISRVMDACKAVGIQLPLPKNLVNRVVFHSNMSLHRGRRVAFSDIWYIYEILRIISPQMEGINLSDPVLEKLKEKLLRRRPLLTRIGTKAIAFLKVLAGEPRF